MGILLGSLEYMFSAICLMGINMILMFVFGLLRNLPAILQAIRHFVRELLILSYKVYRPLFAQLQPVAHRYLGLDATKTPIRMLAAAFLSFLLLLIFYLALGWRISVFVGVLAILHGGLVGLLWDELEQTDGLRTGERIQ
jgi:hypothetical protein